MFSLWGLTCHLLLSLAFITGKQLSLLIIITSVCILLMVISSSNLRSYFYVKNELNHNNIKLQKIYEFISETTSKSHNKSHKRTETAKSKNSNKSPINALKTKQPKTNDKYKLDTKGCKIGNWPLFDAETRPLYKNLSKSEINCKIHEPIIRIKRVNSTWIQLDWSKLNYKPFCYISELKRGDNEDSVRYGEISGPIESLVNLSDYEFVKVFCYNKETKFENKDFMKTGTITKDGLIHEQFVPLIKAFERIEPFEEIPNILLLFIDSISYLNFERHFPLMKNFVRNNNFYELKGYNKVGINTWPNKIPLFTGYFAEELVDEENRGKIYFDDWPIIWKSFASRGFRTIFTEEMANYGLFTREKKGFRYKPTDYYLRPFTLSIHNKKYLNNFCYKGKLEIEYYFEYFYDFVKATRERREKYFAYISTSLIAHDNFNYAAYMDKPTHRLMSKLFEEDLIDDTVIFFFSDHGIRLGQIRSTHSGEIEARLPFMFIHLPNDFMKESRANLTVNQHRLTTPFDIHSTLMHILRGKAGHSSPHGISLFEEIPDDRDCEKASIQEPFCSCYEDKKLDDLELLKPIAMKIVEKVNSLTEDQREECASFEFDSIHAAYERNLSNTADINFKTLDTKTYLIQVYVKPGKAFFESTVQQTGDKNSEVIGDISRINRYGNQSHCIHNSFLEKYCFCKDLI